MGINFAKLSKVSDSNKIVDVTGYQVSKQESVLDKIDLKEKVADSVKVIFLDNAKIKEIMGMPRERRREILSKVSDAQRREILSRYKQIKDEDSTDYYGLYTSIVNYIVNPADYNAINSIQKSDVPEISDLQKFVQEDTGDFIGNISIFEELDKFFSTKDIKSSTVKIIESLYQEVSRAEDEDLDLTDEDRNLIQSSIDDLSEDYNDTQNASELMDSVYSIVKSFKNKRLEVFDSLVRGIKEKIHIKENKKIRDSIIEKIADKPFIDNDGEEVKEDKDKPVLEVLSNALEAYLNGDEEPIKALSNTTLSGEPANEETTEGSSEGSSEDGSEGAQNKDTEEDPFESFSEDKEDDLADSVRVAKLILSKDNRVNKVLDKLSKKLPDIKKYKINDCDLYEPTSFVETDPMEAPLSRDEFLSKYDPTAMVGNLTHNLYVPLVPQVKSYSLMEPYITINEETYPQTYRYIGSNYPSFSEELGSSDDPRQVIIDNCVSVSDYCAVAAATNNLSAIDNLFYKKKFSDDCWTFDEVPTCLKGECDIKPGMTLIPAYVAGPVDENQRLVNVYGSNYYLA